MSGMEPKNYHALGCRDGIAYVFAMIRDGRRDGRDLAQILQAVAIGYKEEYGENPHVEHFLKNLPAQGSEGGE